MQRCYRPIAGVALLLLLAAACGDDDDPADAGTDSGDEPRAGRGGSGGNAGRGSAGRGGTGGRGGAGGGGAGGDSSTITLRFKAKVGDEDFDCGRTYAGQGTKDTEVRPRDFRFFVQDVRLLTREGDEVAVELDERAPAQSKEVAIIDFAATSGGCSAGGNLTNLTITGRVPAGEYDGVAFTIGVPEELNHQNITSAKPPLQDISTYWNWLSGYRFFMAVVASEAPAGTELEDGGVDSRFGASALHVGSSACTGSPSAGFTCARPYRNKVKLDGFDLESSTIVADLGEVFEAIDLSTPNECHGADAACTPAYAALGLNTDGSALATQSVFRLE